MGDQRLLVHEAILCLPCAIQMVHTLTSVCIEGSVLESIKEFTTHELNTNTWDASQNRY